MANRIVQEAAEQAARGAIKAVRQELNGREDNGWRAGKPVEDPEKTKRWGFVTAKPSEYLVHMRKGKVLHRTSGQGATCFKWPWDSVAIIPTTIQRLFFQADQITSEKVGVQVKGLAVFRVARPELAVTMLNFSFPERAQEKLGATLCDMFVGAARRLIATLSVEDCLTRRKESLAAYLMAEIAPVVSGNGRSADSTDRGWGVVIDTIEIQEVHVLSEAVFKHMQAPYRNQLMLNARQSELLREKETLVKEAMSRREIEEARTRAESQMRELKAQMESEAAKAEAEEEKRRLSLKLETERVRIEREREAERLKLEKEADLAKARAEKEREALAVKAESEAQARTVRAQKETAAAQAEQAEALKRMALVAEAERAKLERERQA
ncbi:MAG: SPFH domain-containing protein, partial [Myxococcales bacterium]